MEPNKEAITKWVEALESEQYAQTYGQLATPGGRKMCAIGVRIHVYRQEVLGAKRSTELDLMQNFSASSLWYGVDSCQPIGETDSGDEFNVIGANDTLRMTFPEIAQHLRKKYL